MIGWLSLGVNRTLGQDISGQGRKKLYIVTSATFVATLQQGSWPPFLAKKVRENTPFAVIKLQQVYPIQGRYLSQQAIQGSWYFVGAQYRRKSTTNYVQTAKMNSKYNYIHNRPPSED